jgi:SP family sugar:H+ symporter-like MFS transporter
MGFALKRPDDAVGSAAPAIMIGLFVAFGGVLFGYVPLTSSILLFSKTGLTVI